VKLNIKQHQLQAAQHGEEIGFSAHWLPAYLVFCWRFGHQMTQVRSPMHRLHSSLTLPLISQVGSRALASFAFRQAVLREIGRCLIRVTPREFSLASSAVSD
jgi:hypothetical protein